MSMTGRASIDVSRLPNSTMDSRSPIWWGNILLLAIETTMFALTIAAYLYFRFVDYQQWPPPQSNGVMGIEHPYPALTIATVNTVVILISFLPMLWVDRACLKRSELAVKAGLILVVLLGIAAILLRFAEFPGLKFRWNDNAYASVVWTLLGLHLTHLIVATCENGLMIAWAFAKGLDDKHFRDVRVTTIYWYWIVGIWVLLYVLIYWSPRW